MSGSQDSASRYTATATIDDTITGYVTIHRIRRHFALRLRGYTGSPALLPYSLCLGLLYC